MSVHLYGQIYVYQSRLLSCGLFFLSLYANGSIDAQSCFKGAIRFTLHGIEKNEGLLKRDPENNSQ
jgi:hypothetical protein